MEDMYADRFHCWVFRRSQNTQKSNNFEWKGTVQLPLSPKRRADLVSHYLFFKLVSERSRLAKEKYVFIGNKVLLFLYLIHHEARYINHIVVNMKKKAQ